ncbi:nucleotidyl transferase AbiEii/AbiGii toxin family protein [Kitasatospora sp. NPDC051914]|uniref:nucleotidyl transferase AbiEii/AbiGii toxin family protein n=1 Tax=Kitasatospora sp. NPDC051914 TaxID=3154945 RepID=UPI0034237E87
MAVELPEPLQWVLMLLAGSRWPEGDEDLMRDMARRWRAAAETVDESGRAADSAVRRALDGQQGASAEALEKQWAKLVLPVEGDKPGFFPGMTKACNAMADALEAMANSTETAKISIVAQLGILAYEIATAEAAAPVTAGASLATIPAAVAASRETVKQILSRLAKEILVIALKEAFQEVAINLLAQTIQLAAGNRKTLDGKELGMSAAGGAVGGAAGGLAGKGLGAAGNKLIGKHMDSLPAQMVHGALSDVAGDVAAQLATTGEVDGAGLGGSALSGAGNVGVMRGASALKGRFAAGDIPDTGDLPQSGGDADPETRIRRPDGSSAPSPADASPSPSSADASPSPSSQPSRASAPSSSGDRPDPSDTPPGSPAPTGAPAPYPFWSDADAPAAAPRGTTPEQSDAPRAFSTTRSGSPDTTPTAGATPYQGPSGTPTETTTPHNPLTPYEAPPAPTPLHDSTPEHNGPAPDSDDTLTSRPVTTEADPDRDTTPPSTIDDASVPRTAPEGRAEQAPPPAPPHAEPEASDTPAPTTSRHTAPDSPAVDQDTPRQPPTASPADGTTRIASGPSALRTPPVAPPPGGSPDLVPPPPPTAPDVPPSGSVPPPTSAAAPSAAGPGAGNPVPGSSTAGPSTGRTPTASRTQQNPPGRGFFGRFFAPSPPQDTADDGAVVSLTTDPEAFLDSNLVKCDMLEGLMHRMAPGWNKAHCSAFLNWLNQNSEDGRTHYFVLAKVPAEKLTTLPGGGAPKPTGTYVHLLTPAVEKYAAEISADPVLNKLPPVPSDRLTSDRPYLEAIHVPYLNGAPSVLPDSAGAPPRVSNVGVSTVPTDPVEAGRPQFVVTPPMNGCALAVTPGPDDGSFLAWHFQSPDSNSTAADAFREHLQPTDWYGHDKYHHERPGQPPIWGATNMLWWDSSMSRWMILTQEYAGQPGEPGGREDSYTVGLKVPTARTVPPQPDQFATDQAQPDPSQTDPSQTDQPPIGQPPIGQPPTGQSSIGPSDQPSSSAPPPDSPRSADRTDRAAPPPPPVPPAVPPTPGTPAVGGPSSVGVRPPRNDSQISWQAEGFDHRYFQTVGADRVTQLVDGLPTMAPEDRARALAELEPEHRRWIGRNHALVDRLRAELPPVEFAAVAVQFMLHVDPRCEQPAAARTAAEAALTDMLRDPDTTARLLKSGAGVTVVPKDVKMTEVPGFGNLAGTYTGGAPGVGRLWDDVRGSGGLHTAITEENLLGEHTTVGPGLHYEDGYSTTTHEFAHTIHQFGLSDEDKRLITEAYQSKIATDDFTRMFGEDSPMNWSDGRRWSTNPDFDNYGATNELEYFAQVTNAYLGTNHGADPYTWDARANGRAWVRANEPELLPLLEKLYGTGRTPFPAGANPVAANDALADLHRLFDTNTSSPAGPATRVTAPSPSAQAPGGTVPPPPPTGPGLPLGPVRNPSTDSLSTDTADHTVDANDTSRPEDVESEFRFGMAALLQSEIRRVLELDESLKRYADATLTLGGGGGVAAVDYRRPVKDLDMRLDIPRFTPADSRKVLEHLAVNLLTDGRIVEPPSGNGAARRPTTVTGRYGVMVDPQGNPSTSAAPGAAGVEVSITLAPVQSTTLPFHPVVDPTEKVELSVVAPERLLEDKLRAMAGRPANPHHPVKIARDFRDIATITAKLDPTELARVKTAISTSQPDKQLAQALATVKDTKAITNSIKRYTDAVRDGKVAADGPPAEALREARLAEETAKRAETAAREALDTVLKSSEDSGENGEVDAARQTLDDAVQARKAATAALKQAGEALSDHLRQNVTEAGSPMPKEEYDAFRGLWLPRPTNRTGTANSPAAAGPSNTATTAGPSGGNRTPQSVAPAPETPTQPPAAPPTVVTGPVTTRPVVSDPAPRSGGGFGSPGRGGAGTAPRPTAASLTLGPVRPRSGGPSLPAAPLTLGPVRPRSGDHPSSSTSSSPSDGDIEMIPADDTARSQDQNTSGPTGTDAPPPPPVTVDHGGDVLMTSYEPSTGHGNGSGLKRGRDELSLRVQPTDPDAPPATRRRTPAYENSDAVLDGRGYRRASEEQYEALEKLTQGERFPLPTPELLHLVNPHIAPAGPAPGFRFGNDLHSCLENVEAYRDTHFGRPRPSGQTLTATMELHPAWMLQKRHDLPHLFGTGQPAVNDLLTKVRDGGPGSFATVMLGREGEEGHAVALVHTADGRLLWVDASTRQVRPARGDELPDSRAGDWKVWAAAVDRNENRLPGLTPDQNFLAAFGATGDPDGPEPDGPEPDGPDQTGQHDQDVADHADEDEQQEDPGVPPTPEHALATSPVQFLEDNVLSPSWEDGIEVRTPGLLDWNERQNFIRLVGQQSQHWFVLVPDPRPGRARAAQNAYLLTPALEKYIQADPENFGPLVEGREGQVPQVMTAEGSYLTSPYIPFKSGATRLVDGPEPRAFDTSLIGHVDIPVTSEGTGPGSGLVFTAGMNGCALTVTPSSQGADHFTAWHYQSPSSRGSNWKAAIFRRDHRPTDWSGWEEYESGVSSSGTNFEVTNVLWNHQGQWTILSQEYRETPNGSAVTLRQRPLRLDPPTESDQAVRTARIYAGLAEMELRTFEHDARRLLDDPRWTPAQQALLEDGIAEFTTVVQTHRDNLKALGHADPQVAFAGLATAVTPLPGPHPGTTTFADLTALAGPFDRRRGDARIPMYVAAGLEPDPETAEELQQRIENFLLPYFPRADEPQAWPAQLLHEATDHPSASAEPPTEEEAGTP